MPRRSPRSERPNRPPAPREIDHTVEIDCTNLDHDCEVFVNRWCSLFGHRATALRELRELIARVQSGVYERKVAS